MSNWIGVLESDKRDALSSEIARLFRDYQPGNSLEFSDEAVKPLRSWDGHPTGFCVQVARILESQGVKRAHPQVFRQLYRKMTGKSMGLNIVRNGCKKAGVQLSRETGTGQSDTLLEKTQRLRSPRAVIEAALESDNNHVHIPESGGIIESMGMDNTANFVDNIGRDGDPNGASFEAIRNSLAANATFIDLTVDKVRYNKTMKEGDPILDLAIIDNGDGFDRHTLKNFNKLSSSTKEMGIHGARGLGIRATLLFNGYCDEIMVCTWTRGGPASGLMSILRRDQSGRIGAVGIDFLDEEGDEVRDTIGPVPPEYAQFFQEVMGGHFLPGEDMHGVILIARGGPHTKHSFFGPRSTGGLHLQTAILQSRFHTLPQGVKIRALDMVTKDTSKWAPTYSKIHTTVKSNGETSRYGVRRTIKGRAGMFTPRARDRGVATGPSGCKFHWWTIPDKKHPNPPSGAAKGSTHFDLYRKMWSLGFPKSSSRIWSVFAEDGFSEVYDHVSVHGETPFFTAFGIPNKSRRFVLIGVEPPKAEFDSSGACVKAGVGPNTARSGLAYFSPGQEGGSKFPWADFGEEFQKVMPKAIKALVKEFTNSDVSLSDVEDKLAEMLQPHMHEFVSSGRYTGPQSPTPNPNNPSPNPTGGRGGSSGGRLAKAKTPIQWNHEEGEPISSKGPPRVAEPDLRCKRIIFYTKNPIFDTEMSYYQSHVVLWSEDAETRIRSQMILQVSYALSLYFLRLSFQFKEGMIDISARDSALSPVALSSVASQALITGRTAIRQPVSNLGWK